ncbi:hypothetical protein RN001_014231 [Aquatica leii]|uniref:Uncharacterized protein n=1 Tax=Aquatica leii TaxID=1421715 RepID=A0AAN7P3Z5_9COLE|nr:hypothetical protein RN001_014231 [Aquatica leii]
MVATTSFKMISHLTTTSVRIDQRASCAGLETGTGRASRKPPPLLRSRTLPAIVVPGVNILQAQLGNYNQDVQSPTSTHMGHRVSLTPRCHSAKVWDDCVTVDARRKSAISRLCGSGNYGPERGADGTVLLRVPAPHVVAARAYRISSPSTSGTGLYKLTRLLNQSAKHQMIVDDTNVPRRLSWERKLSNTRLPRSSSIDSMVETIWADSISEATTPPPVEKRPSIRLERPLALVSPTVGRRMKGQRGINETHQSIASADEFSKDETVVY